jgi:hypothetical protein
MNVTYGGVETGIISWAAGEAGVAGKMWLGCAFLLFERIRTTRCLNSNEYPDNYSCAISNGSEVPASSGSHPRGVVMQGNGTESCAETRPLSSNFETPAELGPNLWAPLRNA